MHTSDTYACGGGWGWGCGGGVGGCFGVEAGEENHAASRASLSLSLSPSPSLSLSLSLLVFHPLAFSRSRSDNERKLLFWGGLSFVFCVT